jgi:two-component system, NarL family, nitrate/nitrite response regulator NarL
MSERDVRVLVADDHPPHRDDIARAIGGRQGLALDGVTHDGREALAAIRGRAPHVCVAGVALPGLGGVDLAAVVSAEGLATRVLLVSATPETVYEGVAAGAAGYLVRGARPESVCAAIEAVARGATVLAEEAQDALARCIRERSTHARTVLTDREREVLALTADGLSAPQIGERIHLSPTTVKSHLHRAYDKLGVSDRAAAVAVAIRSGLLA